MKVKIMNREYEMPLGKYLALQEEAAKQTPRGIYAVEKSGYVELRNDTGSRSYIKKLRRAFKSQGYKVHVNG